MPDFDRALVRHLGAATAAIRSLLSAAACSCALVLPGGETIQFVAAAGIGAEEIVGRSLDTGRGIAGWVIVSAQALVVADVRAEPRFARDVAEQTGYVPSSIMAVPLLAADGEVLGVLEVLDHQSAASTGRDLDTVATIAQSLAVAVAAMTSESREGPLLRDRRSLESAVARLADDPAGALLAARVLDAVQRYRDGEQ